MNALQTIEGTASSGQLLVNAVTGEVRIAAEVRTSSNFPESRTNQNLKRYFTLPSPLKPSYHVAVPMDSIAKPPIPLEIVEAKLSSYDDPNLWQTVLAVLAHEFLERRNEESRKEALAMVLGACSHWVRPHNSFWNAGGGFVNPEGYQASIPEFDWSLVLLFRGEQWIPVPKLPGKRFKVFRVAVPTRTTRHKRAAIHTRWFPGDETILFGFRNQDGKWRCVASQGFSSKGRSQSSPD